MIRSGETRSAPTKAMGTRAITRSGIRIAWAPMPTARAPPMPSTTAAMAKIMAASMIRSTMTVPKMAALGAPHSRARYQARMNSPIRSGNRLLAMKPTATPAEQRAARDIDHRIREVPPAQRPEVHHPEIGRDREGQDHRQVRVAQGAAQLRPVDAAHREPDRHRGDGQPHPHARIPDPTYETRRSAFAHRAPARTSRAVSTSAAIWRLSDSTSGNFCSSRRWRRKSTWTRRP